MGQILAIDGNKFKIKMGSMQVTLGVSDLEKASMAEKKLIEESKARMNRGSSGGIHDANRPSAPGNKIDLRGERFEVAMQKLEAYIDQAFRSGAYAEITIVHGLGTGAIREGARKLLDSLPYVKSVRDGGAGGGGAGASIVEFEH
jgi:DNA mismatch repair protein MutS2